MGPRESERSKRITGKRPSLNGARVMASLELVSPPSELPISAEEFKTWARISHVEEDDVIESIIRQATDEVERSLGRLLINQVWRQTLDHSAREWAWPVGHDQVIRLRKPPLMGVASVEYVSSIDGATYELDPSHYVVTRATSTKGSIARKLEALSIPLKTGNDVVSITYFAGYGYYPGDVPAAIRNAVKTVASAIFETRGAFVDVERIVSANCPGHRVFEII